MDFSVTPDSKIARLPRPLQGPAVVARVALTLLHGARRQPTRPTYVFEADGMATAHYSPFLEDSAFAHIHEEMAAEWFVGLNADTRWRMWLLTRLARQCRDLPGNYAEFGVYRAGCAYMMLATAGLPTARQLFLFDTFSGIPDDLLTDAERAEGLGGALTDTSVEYVSGRLLHWEGQITIIEGDVLNTLAGTETGELAFVHMDLNAAKPTRAALDYVYPRLLGGAIVVFDDYGWKGLEAQRVVVEQFLADKTEDVIALPTGQGMLIKH